MQNETTLSFRSDDVYEDFVHDHVYERTTSQAQKRQARRGSQLVSMNLLTFLFQHLSSDLEYFYLEAAGIQKDTRGL